jgi:LysM repeat protein
VSNDETMNKISQMYGIKLYHLYKLNRMKSGTEPLSGETLSLRKKIKKEQIIKLQQEDVPVRSENAAPANNSKTEFSHAEKKNLKEISSKYLLHTVKDGDTMYSIASLYGILVTDLKKLNDKEFNYLDVGEVLKVGEKK